MPFLVPNQDDPRLEEILRHLGEIELLMDSEGPFFDLEHESTIQQHKEAIHELVFEIYDLHPTERQLVMDILEYGVEFFNWSKRKTRKPREAKPVKRPDIPMLKAYAQIFTRAASSLLQTAGQTLNATIFENGAPLTVLSFDLVSSDDVQEVRVVQQSDAMRTKLRELSDLALERKTPSMYTRRHVRIYDGRQVSLIRPSEQRFWTESQARVDADAFLAELFSE